jgi:hypothetical protein
MVNHLQDTSFLHHLQHMLQQKPLQQVHCSSALQQSPLLQTLVRFSPWIIHNPGAKRNMSNKQGQCIWCISYSSLWSTHNQTQQTSSMWKLFTILVDSSLLHMNKENKTSAMSTYAFLEYNYIMHKLVQWIMNICIFVHPCLQETMILLA